MKKRKIFILILVVSILFSIYVIYSGVKSKTDEDYETKSENTVYDTFEDLIDCEITEEQETTATGAENTYILKTNSKKFHYEYCSSARAIYDENRKVYTGNREEIISKGYMPCKRCKP